MMVKYWENKNNSRRTGGITSVHRFISKACITAQPVYLLSVLLGINNSKEKFCAINYCFESTMKVKGWDVPRDCGTGSAALKWKSWFWGISTCADLANDKDDLFSENNFEQANYKWWFCTLDWHGTVIFRGIAKESEQLNPFMKDPFTKGMHTV